MKSDTHILCDVTLMWNLLLKMVEMNSFTKEKQSYRKLVVTKVETESEVAQSCPTLRNPMDCSLPGSSVHGIFQARVLEWGAIAFSVAILGPLQLH